MRPRGITFALTVAAALLLVFWTVTRIRTFTSLFVAHSGIVLTQDQVASSHNASQPQPRTRAIPKITHQIFHNWNDKGNDTLPADWAVLRQTCIDLHSDDDDEWQHMLWTQAKSHDFVATNFPSFLAIYDNYRYPVQRVDALRYLLLYHYGGIYLDLDNGCLRDLEPLLYYPAWTTEFLSGGPLNNNLLGSSAKHPFFGILVSALEYYGPNDYFMPYITVSYTTGQWFETIAWERYHQTAQGQAEPLYRILVDNEPTPPSAPQGPHGPVVFFSTGRGGTWNQWDNFLFAWTGAQYLLIAVLVAAVVRLLWWRGRRTSVARRGRYDLYNTFMGKR
ncbi:hypothetical protein SODALDRAFT_324552 [Sodiomyces alkalinus F11]|uniref:Mannosyl phosphorylinositol ceramide synthase SUR1 n=1 Tax=Sodiomyces alkalinus (strain CBS 110278 / VKM F-3762 / F11) TaxID=1314773 RepID=A0A3N2PUE2_SODAK|nr:hypothetical protein SODALDRAFT_324552 [Sodiomyces alkalinus F11]ROT38127.1 hypothetical protein SODALDRAFT_324552 [Sodiomyces alkalinus F11]